jgi:hypothetical protein
MGARLETMTAHQETHNPRCSIVGPLEVMEPSKNKLTSFAALKGRNRIAQGNALG